MRSAGAGSRGGVRAVSLLSFGVGALAGAVIVSVVLGSGRIDTWKDYLGVFAIALFFQHIVWPLLARRPWRR